MVLIGTAGHVDHGKSTLVEALTGVNPMHLPEEKKREMTIALGFARLQHPDGYTLSIVDVPGHEKLVKTMVSGATGFQLALWVVDPREGLMPQSLEHLQILDLLGAATILPVLTKADVAAESDIRETTEAVRRELARVSLPTRPVQVVDSLSGRGVPELRQAIFAACRDLMSDSKKADAPCYMPIDRCFVVKGIGLVVTGTLVRGRLQCGDVVSISSGAGSWRIRSLHNHNSSVAAIAAGQRAGVNLHGVKAELIRRGDTLVAENYPFRARRFNVELKLLDGAPFRWKSGLRALFLAGSFEMECRLWGLTERGGRRWVQVELPTEVCFYAGQRFILRSTNPLTTIGGGTVLDLAPDRARRITPAELAAYEIGLGAGSLARYIELAERRDLRVASLGVKWMRTAEDLLAEIERSPSLNAAGAKISGQDDYLIWPGALDELAGEMLTEFIAEAQDQDRERPFSIIADRLRIRREHVKPYLDAFLQSASGARFRELLVVTPSTLRFQPRRGELSDREKQIADAVLARLRADGLRPARLREYFESSGADRKTFDKAIAKLIKDESAIRIDNEFVIDQASWVRLRSEIAALPVDSFTPSDFGKYFDLSRKYSMPYLECLGRMGVVRRHGDRHYVVRNRKR